MTMIPGDVAHALRGVQANAPKPRLNTWQSVRAEVLSRIRSGQWPPGELIPTEHELAAELGCARATVNRALRELADSGIVERRRKVGTRVAMTPARRTTLEMSAIRQEIEATSAQFGFQVLSAEIVTPPPSVARRLQITAQAKVMVAQTQYTANGRPHCAELLWLNLEALPPVTQTALSAQPPHEWLARHVALTHGRFTILAEPAGPDEAGMLRLAPATPVLVIERVNWSDATPVSFSRQIYPPGYRLMSED